MKKILTALVVLAMVAPVMADTDIRTQISATGITDFHEFSAVFGEDWSEGLGNGVPLGSWNPSGPSREMTGYELFSVWNAGSMGLGKQVTNPNMWEMTMDVEMGGNGETEIGKEVAWWTEDTQLNPDGTLAYPTLAHIYTYFETATLLDKEELNNNHLFGPAQDYSDYPNVMNFFGKSWSTDDDFQFKQSTGINHDRRCEVNEPYTPKPPVCYFNCE